MKKNRNIFVEVDSRHEPSKPRPSVPDVDWSSRRQIAAWLIVLLAGVILTLLAGGITRLWDAGLSITEWRPVTGVIPPLNDAGWQVEFNKYKSIPEFALQNSAMALEDFKFIYWLEWGHRFLARAIGLIWIAGFAWFALRRQLRPGWPGRLLTLGVLGGIQGILGWWMVSSGLEGSAIDVASYRLALHLVLALLICGLLLWYVLMLGREQHSLFASRRSREVGIRQWSHAAIILIGIQALLGAFVAGIDAGSAFPTWPLMNGSFFPADGLALEPMTRNFLENPGLVQFNHRIGAYATAVLVAVLWWKGRSSPFGATRMGVHLLAAATLLQIVLGILAAVLAAEPRVSLLHQAGAVAMFLLAINCMFQSSYPMRRSSQ